ncbi:MAG: STAS domain-containing protein [Actinomycetota bacterium]
MAGLEEPPTPPVRAVRPPPEPTTIVVVMSAPIAREDVAGLCERFRVLLEGSPADQIVCDVEALVAPDAVTVDVLARLQLTARRLGRWVRVRHACGELQDLLALMGLGDAVPLCGTSAVEARGQTEQREQPIGVEEESDPADQTG